MGQTWGVDTAQEPVTQEPVTLGRLEAAIRGSWDRETSDTPDRYDPGNPERDQCGPTSLVVHDYLGETFGPVDVMERPTLVSAPAQERYDLLRRRVAAALASVG